MNGSYTLHKFPGDAFGGVTSAVVVLPMALAFGVVSGLGPVAGLYGAIAVGFFAAVFGGTPSQISGPTGPMTVAMAAVVTLHADNLTHAFTIVMLAGVLQISLGCAPHWHLRQLYAVFRHFRIHVRNRPHHYRLAGHAILGRGSCLRGDAQPDRRLAWRSNRSQPR